MNDCHYFSASNIPLDLEHIQFSRLFRGPLAYLSQFLLGKHSRGPGTLGSIHYLVIDAIYSPLELINRLYSRGNIRGGYSLARGNLTYAWL